MTDVEKIGRCARRAAESLTEASADIKNACLLRLADLLEAGMEKILAANSFDVRDGKRALTEAMSTA